MCIDGIRSKVIMLLCFLISLKEAAGRSTLKPQEKTNRTSLSSAGSLSALHLSLFHVAPSLP